MLLDGRESRFHSRWFRRKALYFTLMFVILLMASGFYPHTSYGYGVSGGNGKLTAVSASHSHTVALMNDGTVWTWGDNGNHQLGYVAQGGMQLMPRQVKALSGKQIVAVAAGGNPGEAYPDVKSAFTLALDNEGYVWAWGSNNKGQLGNGLYADSDTPAKVKLDSGSYLQVTGGQLAAGFDFAAILDPVSKKVFTWGENVYGQLGDPTVSTAYAQAVKTSAGVELTNVASIAAGGQHALAVMADKSLYAWGRNNFGQLGNGSTDNSPYALPVSSLSGKTVEAVSAGAYHNLAYISGDTYKMWSWGDNRLSQLGLLFDYLNNYDPFTGQYTAEAKPVNYFSDTTPTAPFSLSAGGSYSVYLDDPNQSGLTLMGIYYSTALSGGGGAGALQKIALNIGTLNALATGYRDTFALTDDGKLWGWGYNESGQLGTGRIGGLNAGYTEDHQREPAEVAFPKLADLSELSISQGTLSPGFDPNVTSYSATVGNLVSSVDITLTSAYSTAKKIAIGTSENTGASYTGPLSLNVGSNSFEITVTGQDDSTKTYNLSITRSTPDNSALSSKLSEVWDKLNGIIEGVFEGAYRTGTKLYLQSKYDEAYIVYQNSAATQQELDQATAELNAGLAEIETMKAAHRSGLDNMIDGIRSELKDAKEGVSAGQYQQGAKAELQAAVNAAIAADNNAAATQSDIDAALTALMAAHDIFKSKMVPPVVVYSNDFESQSDEGYAVPLVNDDGLWSHGTPAIAGRNGSASRMWTMNIFRTNLPPKGNGSYYTRILESSAINLQNRNAQKMTLSFWIYQTAAIPGIGLKLSKDGGSSWSVQERYVVPGEWTKVTVNLDPSYWTSSFKFGFDVSFSSLYDEGVLIDDVSIERYYTAYEEVLSAAQTLYDGAVEGTAIGQYASSSKQALNQAMTAAAAVKGTSTPADSAYDEAVIALNIAMERFKSNKYAAGKLYVQDFETNDGGYSSSKNGSGYEQSSDAIWMYGQPLSGPGAAHSGSKVWATNLTGFYDDNMDALLTSPSINLTAAAVDGFDLSWWQWMDTESCCDTLSLKVSKDGGTTWDVGNEPFKESGEDKMWVRRKVHLDSDYAVSGFRFRFQFASDSSVNGSGVYLDDITISGVDTSHVDSLVERAGQLLSAAKEGNAVGYYASGAIAGLQSAIQSSKATADKNKLTPMELDSALSQIEQGIASFAAKEIQPVSTFSNDFESSSGGFTATGAWHWGGSQSDQVYPYSGTKLWRVSPESIEGGYTDNYLESPAINALNSDAWKLTVSWMQRMELDEWGGDGTISLEVSKDGGASWQRFFAHKFEYESEGPALFNVVEGVDNAAGGTSLNVLEWQRVSVDLDPSYMVDKLKIRYNARWYYGDMHWYIDDVKIAAYPKDLGYYVKQAETLLAHAQVGTGNGQYQGVSISGLQTQYNTAKTVVENPGAAGTDISASKTALANVLEQFRSNYNKFSIKAAEEGSYAEFAGKTWRIIDAEHGGLLLDSRHAIEMGPMPWSTATEGIDNQFVPGSSSNLAYYLNNSFYNGLNGDRSWIVSNNWDVRSESVSSNVYVAAKVGLLSSRQYDELVVNGVLNGPEGSSPYEWWLITPSESGAEAKYVGYVDAYGNVGYSLPWMDHNTRPVVYLQEGITVIGGDGSYAAPYILKDNVNPVSNAAELSIVNAGYPVTPTLDPPGYRIDVPADAASLTIPVSISPGAVVGPLGGNVTGAIYSAGTITASQLIGTGPFMINVPITAQDGVTTKNYTIAIYRIASTALLDVQLVYGTASIALSPRAIDPYSYDILLDPVITDAKMTARLQPNTGATVTGNVYSWITQLGADKQLSINVPSASGTVSVAVYTIGSNTSTNYTFVFVRERASLKATLRYSSDTAGQISFSNVSAGTTIYYTLDGSTPTANSAVIDASGKLSVSAGQMVRLYAVSPGQAGTSWEFQIRRRTNIIDVLDKLNRRLDQNGDSIFNKDDVDVLLKSITPFTIDLN